MAATLVMAGCQSAPTREGESAPTAEEQMASDDTMTRVQGTMRKDAQVIAATAPKRNTHEQLVEQNADLEARWNAVKQDLVRQQADALPMQPILPEYNPLDDILISLEMDNEDVRNVLRAIARQTGMNLLIHPEILATPRNISISFEQVPASVVFREVLRLADVHGRIEENVLRVDPFQERVFDLDFLETNASSSFNAGGDVLGAGTTGGGGSGSSGSSGSGAGGQSLQGSFQITGEGDSGSPYEQIAAILDRLVADFAEGGVAPGGSGGGAGERGAISGQGARGMFHINRISGTLYLNARPSVVSTASDLIDRYKRIQGRQILVEARIMEVRLTDQYRAGIDWQVLRDKIGFSFGVAQTLGPVTLTNPIGRGDFSNSISLSGATLGADGMSGAGFSYASGSAAAIVNLLKQFGDVKVLSNPSIRAKHGQPALISVGQTQSFVRESEVTVTGGLTPVTEVDVTTDTVFDGLMIGLIPFVNQNGQITLSIHPVQSSVDQDSLVPIDVGGSARISLPRVDLKQISTTLDLRDGDTVLLGGLIDKQVSNVRRGVPVLSEIPLLGRAFTSNSENEQTREFVLILQVTTL